MPVWLPYALTLLGTVMAGGLTVWGSHLVSKRNAKTADRVADASVQTSINDGFSKLTAGFTAQLDEARAEIIDLKGYIRELIQHIESLEAFMEREGFQPPRRDRSRPHPLTLISPPAPDASHG